LVTIAVFRLPDSLIEQIENTSPLSLSQRGWAFRLLAFFAVVQAAYVGLAVFRPEKVKEARESDPKVARLTRPRLMSSMSRTAATIVFLTMAYGLASLWFTGFRAGFWFFVALALLQGFWYFREIGRIARWLDFQPETALQATGRMWAEPDHYCPPLARGLSPIVEAPAPRR
jgi:hypothetical protein